MRAVVAIVVGYALLACSTPRSANDLPAESWGTSDYVKAGLPAIDHAWTVAEHETALGVLTKESAGHRERLPHRSGAKSGAVFERLVEATPTTDATSPTEAYGLHAQRFEVLNRLSKLYLASETAAAPTEYYAITGRMLHEAQALELGADAFLSTIAADDPTRPVREQGLARMRSGWSTMLLGSLMMVSDIRAPQAASIGLSHDLAAVLPSMYPHAAEPTKQKIKEQLDRMHELFKSGPVKDALPARL
jgi:hypothetical protein